MALLPNKNVLDGSKSPATTTAEMKTALGTLRDFLAGLLGIDSTDTAAARTALSAAKSGANTDITSVGAVTGVTATAGDSTTKLATTAFSTGGIATAIATEVTNRNNAIAAYSAPTVKGIYKNLLITSLGVNNYNCVITADEVVLRNSTNLYVTARSVSKTVNAAGTVGAPLSIMSARAASTWYYRWLWYNAALGLTATLDVSATTPTAPTGYVSTDYNALLPGASRTDASGSTYLLQISTTDDQSDYVVLAGSNTTLLPLMASGTLGTFSATAPTWAAIAVGAFAPTATAKRIRVILHNGYNSGTLSSAIAANSNTYTGSDTTNPPPWAGGGSNRQTLAQEWALRSTNIYAASGAQFGIQCAGWSD